MEAAGVTAPPPLANGEPSRENPSISMLDRIQSWSRGNNLIASKTFPSGSWCFADHFPGKPIVPGSLLLEAMEQSSGWLLAENFDFEKKAFPVLIDQAKFRQFILPGETVEIHAVAEIITPTRATVRGHCLSAGEKKASATMHFTLLSASPEHGHFGESGPFEASATFDMRQWMRRNFENLTRQGFPPP